MRNTTAVLNPVPPGLLALTDAYHNLHHRIHGDAAIQTDALGGPFGEDEVFGKLATYNRQHVESEAALQGGILSGALPVVCWDSSDGWCNGLPSWWASPFRPPRSFLRTLGCARTGTMLAPPVRRAVFLNHEKYRAWISKAGLRPVRSDGPNPVVAEHLPAPTQAEIDNWYKNRVRDCGPTRMDRKSDEAALKVAFPEIKAVRETVRDLRYRLAPKDWTKKGRSKLAPK